MKEQMLQQQTRNKIAEEKHITSDMERNTRVRLNEQPPVTDQTTSTIRQYSFDDNGGGYAGL